MRAAIKKIHSSIICSVTLLYHAHAFVIFWELSVCAPPRTLCSPVTEHVSLHSKLFNKTMARAHLAANKLHQLSYYVRGGGGRLL